jgi:hypothetical protein
MSDRSPFISVSVRKVGAIIHFANTPTVFVERTAARLPDLGISGPLKHPGPQTLIGTLT